MSTDEIARLELLAEIDSLVTGLSAWADRAPDWPAGKSCQALVRRLMGRAESLRVRLEAPLVVATLGGTGTGKSTLVNALVGEEITTTGKQRPTTRKPAFISRPEITPEDIGLDPITVEALPCDSPTLHDLVLIDCPDPDTTEDSDQAFDSNLARLRSILPHCDVLLVTSTQQKYRSARVADELLRAPPGARLVFVLTHADTDEDIRDDWKGMLADDYAVGEIFRVDSRTALADAQQGIAPKGEFGRLVDLLTRELAGAAGNRIRRANFLDLVEATLEACRKRVEENTEAVAELEQAIEEWRARLATQMAGRMREELLRSRRQWESRLLGEVAGSWGYSPFSLVLRAYHGLGGLVASSLLLRVRTPAQLAIWGAVQGAGKLYKRSERVQAEQGLERAATLGLEQSELRAAAVIDGYAEQAGLHGRMTDPGELAREANQLSESFLTTVAGRIQDTISQLARQHSGRFLRFRYEFLLLLMGGFLLYRMGRNFFWDSWLAYDLGFAEEAAPIFGLDFLVSAAFWMLIWCGLLLWAFTARLRRGMRGKITELASTWNQAGMAAPLFAPLEEECRKIERFRDDLHKLEAQVSDLRARFDLPQSAAGHRIA